MSLSGPMVDTQFCRSNFVLNNKHPYNLFKLQLQLLTYSLQIFFWNVSIL